MGVSTSSELFARKEDTGVSYVGGKPDVVINPDAIRVFLFPTPIHGESSVFLDVGNKKPTKLNLEDGVYKIPKGWGKDKKSKYREALLKAGFTETSYVEGAVVKEPEVQKKYMYFAGHPDNKDTDKVNAETAIEIKGEVVQLEIVEGMIVTEDEQVYKTLLEKGYYEAKPPKEIEE